MAADSRGPAVVALLSRDEELVHRLRHALSRAGLEVVVPRHASAQPAAARVRDLVVSHDPHVIFYEIAFPYDREWRSFQQVQSLPELAGCAFVLASANVRRVAELAGTSEEILEIGEPHHIDRVTDAVRQAARARPVR